MTDEESAQLLPVWRPTRDTRVEEPRRPLGCGDMPLYTVDERFELARALKREWDADRPAGETTAKDKRAKEKQASDKKAKDKEARDKEAKREAADEGDETRVVERYRNDRYSVKLLQQTNDVWGGASGDEGVLG